MNRQVQPYETVPAQLPSQVTPVTPVTPVTAQSFQAVMAVIMAVWAGAWVLSQIVKMVKGKAVEKPPLILE